ncbi:MAG: AMP-binding protein [Chitinophagaceae bacterium]|nr:AMP-binding protein [Chitinophagaceae bacterium]MBK9487075.1 AMP-binding protein [Chitinophagaceae bacterium]MBL0199475.1 AMP-binding protein [Chitinophagaceae bacterium]
MNYSPESAFLSKEEIVAMQEKKLQETIAYLNQYSPFYKEFFSKARFNPSGIKTMEDLSVIPVTIKEDLQQRNEDFLCVPRNKIIEYSSTSGTLGNPVTIMLTENDLSRLACNEYASLVSIESSVNDIYQIMLTLDRQFMAGMAYYSGIQKLGGGIIRLGPGVPSLQWETILRLKPTAIIAVPSFIVKLISYAQEHKIDINSTTVKKALCVGENIRNADFSLNALGKKITDAWDIKLFSTYASTEMQTAFTECTECKGGHLQPDLLIVELLDEMGKAVVPGEPGEVTITTLGVEGMPLLRYKTGDICVYDDTPCACGRNSLRLSPVMGRKKQMLKYKGTTLYPPALFDILHEMENVIEYVAEVSSNEMGTDEVLIYIVPDNFDEETNRKIRANLQARLRVSPHIKYITEEEIKKIQMPEAGRKIIRFIDRRN